MKKKLMIIKIIISMMQICKILKEFLLIGINYLEAIKKMSLKKINWKTDILKIMKKLFKKRKK
jgi:hypothetical protein